MTKKVNIKNFKQTLKKGKHKHYNIFTNVCWNMLILHKKQWGRFGWSLKDASKDDGDNQAMTTTAKTTQWLLHIHSHANIYTVTLKLRSDKRNKMKFLLSSQWSCRRDDDKLGCTVQSFWDLLKKNEINYINFSSLKNFNFLDKF